MSYSRSSPPLRTGFSLDTFFESGISSKVVRSCIVAILNVFVSIAAAQQGDSLVDVFPLSVGNTWLYQYHYDYYFYKPPTHELDTGRVEMKIIEKHALHDTLGWDFLEHRMVKYHIHKISPYGGGDLDTTYVVDTTVTMSIVETGEHELTTAWGS